MSAQGNNDDCYFYYYSSCTKGDDCPFRHSEAALGTETVCTLWREGVCFRDNCKFRHMESRINRGNIQCYWEDQPSGCLKPHCVFLHRKPRSTIGYTPTNDGLILPVSATGSQLSPAAKATETKDSAKNVAYNPVESYSNNNNNNDINELSPTSHPVEPIVVSFDGEESDSESASSTPMKSVSESKYNSNSVKSDLMDSFLGENNLGIKTLEQIKMEKIHKESDNIYKSAYDAPYLDPAQMKKKTECYPPQSDFIAISDRPIEKTVSVTVEPTRQFSPDTETAGGGIKSRLSKRKAVPTYSETSLPPKKSLCLKKNKDSLDFKIKTLDEIRREKQNKSSYNEETPIEHKVAYEAVAPVDDSPKISLNLTNSKNESSNLNGRSLRKIKLNRQSKELLSDSNVSQEVDSSTENQTKDTRSQTILHEVQNIAEDQKKMDIKGKRKNDAPCSEDVSAKQFKSDSSFPSSTNIPDNNIESKAIVEEKQLNKLNRPIIKRKVSTTTSLPSKSLPDSEISSSTVLNDCGSSTITVPKENIVSSKEDKSKSSEIDTTKTTKSSIDELDSFLMNEPDVSLDYESTESDDILLEIEQLLDS